MTEPVSKLAGALLPLRDLKLDEHELACLRDAATPQSAVERLEAAGHLQAAARLVAQALPKREAVWWACMCCRAVPGLQPQPAQLAWLDAAELWVRRPAEETRRGCVDFTAMPDLRVPEGWAAMGAFWSGGSVAPETAADIPAGPGLTAAAVEAAVLLAAMRDDAPAQQPARLRRFLNAARDIALGGAGRLAPEGTA
jgi:hypothetical protein